MSKKFRFSIFLIMITLFIVFFMAVIFFSAPKINSNQKNLGLDLPPQVQVEFFTQFTIKPYILIPGKPITFLISMESFQNPEMLEISLKDAAYLEDEKGNVAEPIKWEILQKDQYKVSGKLTFNTKFQDQQKLILNLADSDDTPFIWELLSKTPAN